MDQDLENRFKKILEEAQKFANDGKLQDSSAEPLYK